MEAPHEGGGGEDRPRARRDYPRDWPEFQRFFPDEQACLDYLERLRWPHGFRYPACGSKEGWRTKRDLWVCRACERQTSVTAGTLFAGTRTPLLNWFAAIWQLVSQKQGMSALGFKRAMGLGSYETAWAHLHKLRRAMVRPGRELLDGLVEVDEAYVGGRDIGTDGRQTAEKSIVICAVEVRPGVRESAGRIRLSRLDRATKPALEGWLLGTHQGSVQPHQLDYYLDEFTFRFNRRRSRYPGLLFYRLVQEAGQTEPIPLKRILGGEQGREGTGRSGRG